MRQLFHTYLLECRESEARMKETPTEAVSYCLLLTLLAGPSNTPLNLLGIGERQCNVRLLLVIDMISANDDLAFFVAASRTALESTGASFFFGGGCPGAAEMCGAVWRFASPSCPSR